jgi:hypothetical protein
MLMSRCWLVTVAAIGLAGCTEPNPFYTDAGCTAGKRQCSGQVAQVCVPANSATSYVADRTCPTGSTCQSGLCVGGQSCTTTCENDKVCSVLVAAGGTSLGNYCITRVGTRTGACGKDADCASGVCLKQGICYRACRKRADCVLLDCGELTLTINGVQGKIQGCVP